MTTKKTKPLSKSEILNAIGDAVGDDLSKKHVKDVVEALVATGHKELKQKGIFVLPGFAKFVVVKRPAKPARKGINPFTKQEQTFAAKPASRTVRARPVKAIRDAAGDGPALVKSALSGGHDWGADFDSPGQKQVHRFKGKARHKYTCRNCSQVRYVPIDDALPPPPSGCTGR